MVADRILAKILWDYLFTREEPQYADFILVPGSHDPDPALYAAELFEKKLAPVIIVSGKPPQHWPEMGFETPLSEAEAMAVLLRQHGIPENAILCEALAENIPDNFRFSANLLTERGIPQNTALIVQKPYSLRRLSATGPIHWPGIRMICTSRPVTYQSYVQRISEPHVIHRLVGEIQRVKAYSEKGWTIHQIMPEPIWDACNKLVERGFTKFTLDQPKPEYY